MNAPSQIVSAAPVVSIGLPVYNGANFLAEAIESILDQTFTDFELIIADNGSTDATPEICRLYASQDPRIRYVRHPKNMGAAKNYNYLVYAASGKYFKWAAHDDLVGKEFLEECLAYFKRCGEGAALVYPNYAVIDENRNHIEQPAASLQCVSEKPAKRLKEAHAALGLVTAVFGVYRRDALLRTGLVGSHISSDFDLLIETALVGKIVKLDGDVLFFRRLHDRISTRANSTRAELLNWFDPEAEDNTHLFSSRDWRFLQSIFRVKGLNPSQRIGATLALAERTVWVKAGRVKRKLLAT